MAGGQCCVVVGGWGLMGGSGRVVSDGCWAVGWWGVGGGWFVVDGG